MTPERLGWPSPTNQQIAAVEAYNSHPRKYELLPLHTQSDGSIVYQITGLIEIRPNGVKVEIGNYNRSMRANFGSLEGRV